MTEACIVGWAHSPFGKLEDPDIESLIGRVAGAAIEDAGIAPHDLDGTFVSLFNNGFSAQDFPASLVLQHVPELRFKPITRYENACASGSAAVYGARDFLLSGRGRFALVIGVEKMTATPGKEVGDALLKASYHKEEFDIPRRICRACSAGSPRPISSATAISPMPWRRSRRRTTRTAWTIRSPRCARTSASTSAALSARKTLTLRRR